MSLVRADSDPPYRIIQARVQARGGLTEASVRAFTRRLQDLMDCHGIDSVGAKRLFTELCSGHATTWSEYCGSCGNTRDFISPLSEYPEPDQNF